MSIVFYGWLSGWWKITESDVFCGKRLSGIFSLSLYCSFVMFSQLKTKDLNRKDVACREFDILVSRILLCMTVWDWQNMREACFIFQESNSVDALSDYFLLPAWEINIFFFYGIFFCLLFFSLHEKKYYPPRFLLKRTGKANSSA